MVAMLTEFQRLVILSLSNCYQLQLVLINYNDGRVRIEAARVDGILGKHAQTIGNGISSKHHFAIFVGCLPFKALRIQY
jgi:hypothetical protein